MDTRDLALRCAELYESGMTLARVADALGLRHAARVGELLESIGVPRRRGKAPPRYPTHPSAYDPRDQVAAEVVELYTLSYPFRLIGERVGLSEPTVLRIIRASRRHLPEAEVEPARRAVEMFDGGLTAREVARALGVHRGRVDAWLAREGRALALRGPRDDRLEPATDLERAVVERRRAGMACKAIAAELGRTPRSVSDTLWRCRRRADQRARLSNA
ncbi:MAG: hypothetical protein RID91_16130 [Azospirillaceae bacterium]